MVEYVHQWILWYSTSVSGFYGRACPSVNSMVEHDCRWILLLFGQLNTMKYMYCFLSLNSLEQSCKILELLSAGLLYSEI